ncbi:MAG: HAD-IA family hydrolase [Microcoleaceae cyanobacterium]
MAELKALIFDVDGTIANTEEEGHRVAFNQAFAEAGYDWNWSVDFYGELLKIGGGEERIYHYLNQYQSQLKSQTNLEELANDLHLIKNQYYQERLDTGLIELRIGVKRLMMAAREQGITLAIATTSAVPNVMALLEKKLDPDWFEVIGAGDMVSEKKPAPDVYHYVLNHLEIEPQNCVVFEDTNQGLTAASELNLTTIITVNDYTKNQDFSAATAVISHLGEPKNPMTVISGDITGEYVTIESLKPLL